MTKARLEFLRSSGIVTPFDPINFDGLLILIGENGSGKTQFLLEIARGNIVSKISGADGQLAAVSASEIKYFTFTDQSLADISKSQNVILNASDDPYTRMEIPSVNGSDHYLLVKKNTIVSHLTDQGFEVPDSVLKSSGAPSFFEDVDGLLGSLPGVERNVLKAAFEKCDAELESQSHSGEARTILRIARLHGVRPSAVSERMFLEFENWGEFEAFNPQVLNIFGRYRQALFENGLARVSDLYRDNKLALTEDEFLERYGRPPWELLNELLGSVDLPYTVCAPPDDFRRPLHIKFQRRGTEVEFDYQQLSSGEKIFLRFLLSIFDYAPDRVHFRFPKIVLLDEVDGTLHPKLMRKWMALIRDFLIDKVGVVCILATHSPTSVVLAPENSIYDIKEGSISIGPIEKDRAVKELTAAIPTLSMNWSGVRAVFVENDTDAQIYQGVYRNIKQFVGGEGAPAFISSGLRRKDRPSGNGTQKDQHIGGGKDVVRKVVGQLSDSGVPNICGLIDWDGENCSTDKVFVIGEGEFYTLENVLLNPISVHCLLKRDFRDRYLDNLKLMDFSDLTPSTINEISETFHSTVFGPDHRFDGEILLIGGGVIPVDERCKSMRGHEFETLVVEGYPPLKKYISRERAGLMNAIVDSVFEDFPELCPSSLKVGLEALLR